MEFKKSGIGVVVGRFQVPEFHAGHKYLLDTVKAQHTSLIVLLGCATGNPSIENPLHFSIRAQMLMDLYPGITVVPVFDCQDDKIWSKNVDFIISALVLDNEVTIYGGRDSFISHYSGKFKTKEIPPVVELSGTEIRDSIQSINSDDFRRGIIWALRNQFPRINPTVDIALFNYDYSRILLGKKKTIQGYIFPGGYFDVEKDSSFEEAAVRELREETSVTLVDGIKGLEYVASFIVDDWRDKGKRDKTLTVLFEASIEDNSFIKAADDLDLVEWVKTVPENINMIADHHKPLFEKIKGLSI